MKENTLTREEKVAIISQNVGAIMSVLGIDMDDGRENTPERVAKMYVDELFSNVGKSTDELKKEMAVFDDKGQYGPFDRTIRLDDIPVHSMCEHHLMPFEGTVSVEYKPKDKIIGLSKIPRIVDFFSRKPQLQENLTREISDFIYEVVEPEWVRVEMKARHTCVSMRGAKVPCETTTNYSTDEWNKTSRKGGDE